MPVSEEGFKGGDRTSLDLPRAGAGAAGSRDRDRQARRAGARQWQRARRQLGATARQRHPRCPGMPARRAEQRSRKHLSGRNNPAGRLPVTFYTGVDQLPPFDDYSMERPHLPLLRRQAAVSLRLRPELHEILVSRPEAAACPPSRPASRWPSVRRSPMSALARAMKSPSCTCRFPTCAGAPLRALRGFKRIHLAPGESKTVQFVLQQRDLSMVTAAGQIVVADGSLHGVDRRRAARQPARQQLPGRFASAVP